MLLVPWCRDATLTPDIFRHPASRIDVTRICMQWCCIMEVVVYVFNQQCLCFDRVVNLCWHYISFYLVQRKLENARTLQLSAPPSVAINNIFSNLFKIYQLHTSTLTALTIISPLQTWTGQGFIRCVSYYNVWTITRVEQPS